jgi:2-polyprenyl-6-methoxyphenol hydroxylase-like FAD-dependent oxidoreductase
MDAKYETNRTLLREVFLHAVAQNTSIKFGCPVEGIKQQSGGKVELIGSGGETLGVYDLVVDTSGVGSPLRRYRVQESDEESSPEATDRRQALASAFTGFSMIHGVIPDPESACDAEFVAKLGQGTLSILGPRGMSFSVQRYGADPSDHRTSFYMFISCPDGPDELPNKLGLHGKPSQWYEDAETLQLIRNFARSAFGENLEPMYCSAIDAISKVAIRPILLHNRAPVFRDNQLPLICIGDALHVVPPWTGKGGNLAMRDALSVAEFIKTASTFPNNAPGTTSSIPLQALRALEQQCMTRAAKETDDAMTIAGYMKSYQKSLAETDDVSFLTWCDLADMACEKRASRYCCKVMTCCCKPFCFCCGCTY